MARGNDEVAALLQEYADLLAITRGDLQRMRSYERAARSVAGHHEDVSGLNARDIQAIPNVGRSIANKIVEYVETGSIEVLEAARGQVPGGVRALTRIPTLGPKRAMELYRELGIVTVDELVQAVHDGQLRGLKGWGRRSEEKILHGIEQLRQASGRVHLGAATRLAADLVAALERVEGCRRAAAAGSLRRMRETVGDLDILAVADRPGPLMEALRRHPDIREVVAAGQTKTTVRTVEGLQVDLRVVAPQCWGAALQYFTGSAEHNVRVREIAVRRGLRLSEYGLFDAETGELIVSETEEQVYRRLGLAWIPPTLREDRGEIDAARRGALPALVTEADLAGDLHTHTDLTDGTAPLERMLDGAGARGYSYYAVTDHAPNLVVQQMTDQKILAQRQRVRELGGAYEPMALLHGTELNIDPDGEVDWPREFLAGFDLCVASVHSHFDQPAEAMTRRIVRACQNPHVHVIGHPTARKLGRRAGVDVDLDAVFDACAETGTALEINSFPERLDLCDEHILRAKRHGVVFAIDSDAHSTRHLANVTYGVGTAQRGWLTPDDVINTWPADRLRTVLNRTKEP